MVFCTSSILHSIKFYFTSSGSDYTKLLNYFLSICSSIFTLTFSFTGQHPVFVEKGRCLVVKLVQVTLRLKGPLRSFSCCILSFCAIGLSGQKSIQFSVLKVMLKLSLITFFLLATGLLFFQFYFRRCPLWISTSRSRNY